MESKNTKNLYQRISAVMTDVQRLKKDKQVGEGNYQYSAMSEEKVTSVIRDAMITHGLVLMPIKQTHTLTDYARQQKIVSISAVDVEYKLVNIDNPSEFEIIASGGTGVDNQDKGVGKAMTYSMKYALLRLFMNPTGQDPDEIHNSELEAQQQRAFDEAVDGAIKTINECKTVAEMSEAKGNIQDSVLKSVKFKAAANSKYNKLTANPAK